MAYVSQPSESESESHWELGDLPVDGVESPTLTPTLTLILTLILTPTLTPCWSSCPRTTLTGPTVRLRTGQETRQQDCHQLGRAMLGVRVTHSSVLDATVSHSTLILAGKVTSVIPRSREDF